MAHPPRPSHLDENLAFRVSAAARLLRASAEAALASENIGAPAFGVLMRLVEGDGLSQGELARLQSVEAPSMCRMIDRLERDGLVERRRSTGDRRIVRIFLTDHGRGVTERGTRLLDTHRQRIADALGDEARPHLLDTLTRLTAALEDPR